MNDISDNVVMPNEQPSIKPYMVECKFTVESKNELGNAMENRRITFEGYATNELYSAIMDVVRNITD